PTDLENRASTWLTRQDGRITFDMPPQALHDLLQEITKLIPSDVPSALVVRDPELRPFLQRVVEFSLPIAMVQASEELLNVEESSQQALSTETTLAGPAAHG